MTRHNDKPAGARGVAYVRTSSDKQDKNSQRESIRRWLDQRGLAVQRWYEDTGSRDLAYRRPDFQRLLKAVEAGEVDWIVVDAQDRFGTRSGYEFGKFATFLQDHGCELWSVLEGHLTADDEIAEVLGLVGGLRSRNEILNKAERSLKDKLVRTRQGQWPGGFVPYGFDVVCSSPDGQEKWRAVIVRMDPDRGIWERLKVYPDGRPAEPFDGDKNFPRKARGEVLRLAPSIRRERVEWVRKIFRWYSTEAVSLRAICVRLNELGADPVFGRAWYVTRLKPMLANPVYLVGQTVYNKRSHGKCLEVENGEYRRVKRLKGKVPVGRKKAESDYVYPEGQYEGLIDKATWDRVQAKLKALPKTDRAPKNSDLWLAGLLYCGHCGRRMVGWHQKSDKSCPLSYTCNTYRQHGRSNPTGCRLHRVNHKVVETLLKRYLDETGQGLEALLAATLDGDDDSFIRGLLEQQEGKQWEYLQTLGRLWRMAKDAGARPPEGKPWTCGSLCAAYRRQASEHRAEVARRLAEKDEEHTRLVEQFANLAGQLARQKANERIQGLEAEIEALQDQLQTLDERVQELRADLECLERSIAVARESLKGDNNRQKAHAVRRVVARIVCRFRHGQAGSQARSILTEVVIEPQVGGPQTFAVDSQRGRG
jgi:DNA invertase Pin-like site-specific DNA recombinase